MNADLCRMTGEHEWDTCNVITETGAAYSQRRCNRPTIEGRSECKRHAAETDRWFAKRLAEVESEGWDAWVARHPRNAHAVKLVAAKLGRDVA